MCTYPAVVGVGIAATATTPINTLTTSACLAQPSSFVMTNLLYPANWCYLCIQCGQNMTLFGINGSSGVVPIAAIGTTAYSCPNPSYPTLS